MKSIKLALMVAVLLSSHYSTARARRRKFDEGDISNEILVEEFEPLPGFSGYRRIDYIIESNVIPEVRVLEPSVVKSEISKRLRKDGYDPYFLKDLSLRIPPESLYGSNRLIDVTLDHGFIVGMSDFHSIDDEHYYSKDFFQLLLVWNRLHVHYKVTVDQGGLKNTGETDIDSGRLLMNVEVPKSNFQKIEMSKVTEVKTKLNGLDSLTDDFKTSVSLEIEIQIKKLLNNEIRNILQQCAKDVLTSYSSEENMLSSYYPSLN